MLPVMYSFRRCPYAMRARLALISSGVEVTLREVVLRDWLRATSEDLAQAQYETLAQGYEIIVPNVAELSE